MRSLSKCSAMGRKAHRYPMMIPFTMPPCVKDDTIPSSDLGNFRLMPSKPCPLCPKYLYRYKYFLGLLRHIQKDHLVNSNHTLIPWSEFDKVAYLRKWNVPFSGYIDLPVKGKKHVEIYLYHYCQGWNPSFRGIE